MRRAAARRPRLPGLDVRPGSVRRARVEAGLSLGKVAGRDISRTAIHLIENGRARPSRPTLELIAARTGKPLSYFTSAVDPALSSPAAFAPELERLEQLFLKQELEGAVALGSAVLARQPTGLARAQTLYFLGLALTQLMRLDEAQPQLEVARQLYQELRDSWMVVECKRAIAKVLFLREDPDALRLSEEALAECRLLEPVPTVTLARLLEDIGAIHGTRHEWTRAVELYQEAIEQAGSLRDLGRLARLYDNMSIAYQEIDNLPMAASSSRRAASLFAVERDQRTLARAENNLGLVLIKQGRLEEAELHLRKALELCNELELEVGRAHVLLSLAELEVKRGDQRQAAHFAMGAADLCERLGETMTEALAHQYLGRIAAADDAETSDREFNRALVLLERAGSAERLIECHVAYARVLQERHDPERAIEHWEAALGAWRPHLAGREPLPFVMVG